MRRVDCRRCGAGVVEQVPWGDGKRTLTNAYMLFWPAGRAVSRGRNRLPHSIPHGKRFFDAVEHVVTFGLAHRTLGQIEAIGVDEIQYAKGHKYLTW
jgi:hypothetical protein